MMRLLLTCCVALGFLASDSSACAGVIYGLSSSNPGRLYTIDPATGQATLAVTISNNTAVPGLDFLNGALYASDVVGPGQFHFGTIDLATGVFTAINNQGGSVNWHGLAANEAANVLYTIDINDGNKLKSITPGGVITTIGPGTGIDGRGLAYDNVNGILYGTTQSNGGLYRIDTVTGTSTLIGNTLLNTNEIGLAYDSSTGTLYANQGGFGRQLFRIDTVTGAATLIGSNGVGVSSITGLAVLDEPAAVAPEPSSLTLLGVATVIIAAYRRRFRRRAVS
jgi:hypothetical protein